MFIYFLSMCSLLLLCYLPFLSLIASLMLEIDGWPDGVVFFFSLHFSRISSVLVLFVMIVLLWLGRGLTRAFFWSCLLIIGLIEECTGCLFVF